MKSMVIYPLVGLFALSGCGIIYNTHDETEREAERLEALARNASFEVKQTPNVFHFESMYVPQLSLKESKAPSWFSEPESVVFNPTPVNEILASVLSPRGISIDYREGVDRYKKVQTGDVKNLGEFIRAFEVNSGYQVEAKEDSIVVSKFITKIFPIRTVGGVYNYSIGKRENTDSNNVDSNQQEYAKSEAVSGGGGEFSTIEGRTDPLADFLSGIELILGCKTVEELAREARNNEDSEESGYSERCEEGASARALPSDYSVIVKGVPSQIERVSKFVEDTTERELRQAFVTLTFVAVEKNKDSALNLDFDVVDSVIGGSKFGLETVSNSASSVLGGIGTRGSATLSHESGSKAIVEALAEQGTVIDSASLKGVALNRRLSKLTDVTKQSFIAERTATAVQNAGSATGIRQEVVESGRLMYLLTNIGENDIVLHISTSISSLIDLDRKGEGDNLVESPRLGDKEFAATVRVNPGQSRYIGGFSVSEVKSLFSGNGLSGYSRSSSDKSVELVMVVTAELL